MILLTADLAHQIWNYDPDTGHFFHKKAPRYGITIGDRAGHFNGKYMMLRFKGREYKCARVAWLMMTGKWPEHQIDHINGGRLDDRFENLREATNAQNCRNRGVRSNNLTGVKGVATSRYGYTSTITANGRKRYLGYFPSIDAAKVAYDAAANELHGDFARI